MALAEQIRKRRIGCQQADGLPRLLHGVREPDSGLVAVLRKLPDIPLQPLELDGLVLPFHEEDPRLRDEPGGVQILRTGERIPCRLTDVGHAPPACQRLQCPGPRLKFVRLPQRSLRVELLVFSMEPCEVGDHLQQRFGRDGLRLVLGHARSVRPGPRPPE
ncbi:hypothetical protein [Streptomyces virginiae]|uniref:hypothetical protein n=1 Tax=unclassified Streptomyces TaxID=2593676 RepID=UPI002E2D1C49|nr:hypothetical protein [Streptomyces virginiae]